jgi:hypothetical protein
MGSATGDAVVVVVPVSVAAGVTGSVEVTEPDGDAVSVESVVSAGDVDSVDGSVVSPVEPLPGPPVWPPVGVGVGKALTV